MPNDFIVQTTIDRKIMATLARFFESQGADIRSISELARLTHETLANIAATKLGIEEVTSTAEATEILQRLTYGTSLLNNRRYGAGHLKNLQNEAIEDSLQFESEVAKLPRTRGRQPSWTETDALKMRQAAERALNDPRIKKLLEEQRSNASNQQE